MLGECKQEQLAFKADVQRVYVSILELGQQQPSLETVFKPAKGLGCSARMLAELAEWEFFCSELFALVV